jgi:hypothetical protein
MRPALEFRSELELAVLGLISRSMLADLGARTKRALLLKPSRRLVRLALEIKSEPELAILGLVSQSMLADHEIRAGGTILQKRTLGLTQRAQQSCTQLAR